MKVSVIMSTYNEPVEYIKESVNSILIQTYKDFEFLIIVDDPSRLDIIDFLQYVEKLDKRVFIEINEKNIGIARSLNKLINKANGEYIFRMDADDISNKDRFEKQLKFMIDNSLDMSASRVNYVDENQKFIHNMNFIKFDYLYEELNKVIKLRNILTHPVWCVKTDIYKKFNGYRDLVPAEDYDFILRLVESNMKLGILNDILLTYRVRSNSISMSNSSSQYAMSYTLRKNFGKLCKLSTEEILTKHQNIMKSKEFIFFSNRDGGPKYYFKKIKIAYSFKIFFNKCFLVSKFNTFKFNLYIKYNNLKCIFLLNRMKL